MRVYASLCRLFPSLKNDVLHVHVNLEHCNLLTNPSLRFWKFHIFATRWALARRLHLKGRSSDDVFWRFCICWYLLGKSWVAGNSNPTFTHCNPCWAKLKGLVLIVFAQDHTDIRCTKDEKGCIFTIVLFGSFESWSVFDLSLSNLLKCSLSILCAVTWYDGMTILLKWWSENFIA